MILLTAVSRTGSFAQVLFLTSDMPTLGKLANLAPLCLLSSHVCVVDGWLSCMCCCIDIGVGQAQCNMEGT